MSAASTYAEAVHELDTPLGKPKIVVLTDGRMLINDATHGPHDEEHPDDGSISEFALKLADKLKEFGIDSDVKRLD